MNTTISNKLAALALALMVNSVIMGGMAYLFNDRLHQAASLSVAGAPVRGIQAIA
jgi:hypothetical protein